MSKTSEAQLRAGRAYYQRRKQLDPEGMRRYEREKKQKQRAKKKIKQLEEQLQKLRAEDERTNPSRRKEIQEEVLSLKEKLNRVQYGKEIMENPDKICSIATSQLAHDPKVKDKSTAKTNIKRIKLVHKRIEKTDWDCIDVEWLRDFDSVAVVIDSFNQLALDPNYKIKKKETEIGYFKPNTISAYYSSIASFLRTTKRLPEYIQKQYSKKAVEWKELYKSNVKLNKIAKPEKYHSWKVIENIVDGVKDIDHKAFMGIQVYNNPRRSDYKNMLINTEHRLDKLTKAYFESLNPKHNYIFIDKTKQLAKFVFIDYKTVSTYDVQTIDVKPKLYKVLIDYIKKNKLDHGEFLFGDMSQSNYSQKLQQLFKKYGGKETGINELRHSRISYHFRNPYTIKDTENLAKEMGTSPFMLTEYRWNEPEGVGEKVVEKKEKVKKVKKVKKKKKEEPVVVEDGKDEKEKKEEITTKRGRRIKKPSKYGGGFIEVNIEQSPKQDTIENNIVLCQCGSKVNKKNLARHKKSKKHVNFVNS